MRALPFSLAAVAVGVTSLAVASPTGASPTAPVTNVATNVVARWDMNEGTGATVMLDSSGNGINGTIGTAILTNQVFDGATGYRWTFLPPNQPPANPQRLVQVADDNRLDPGTGEFSVTIRMRTDKDFGNIVQKGQAGAKGGYWKFENPHGNVHCLFRDLNKVGISVGAGRALNDNQWHVIRCDRTSTGVFMTVDGVPAGHRNGTVGSISNPNPVTIAGKLNCDQIKITCDYFTGSIDYIEIDN
jgi:hypothetical protein